MTRRARQRSDVLRTGGWHEHDYWRIGGFEGVDPCDPGQINWLD